MTSPGVVGYVRLSPGERAEGGLGPAAQRVAIEAHAQKLGLAVRAIFEDGKKSGGKSIEERPGLMQAVQGLQRGDVLVVAKLDRLTRGDQLQGALIEQFIKERGASWQSAAGEGTEDDSPSAVLMRRMVAAFAEYERAMIALRTRAALAIKRARGERTGRVPYGCREGEGGKLEPVPEEQETIADMTRLRNKGWSFGSIARWLNKRGTPTHDGGAWFPATVRRILTRPDRNAPTG